MDRGSSCQVSSPVSNLQEGPVSSQRSNCHLSSPVLSCPPKLATATLQGADFVVVAESLDLFDSPKCTRLATQAWAGRHLRVAASGPAGGTSLAKDSAVSGSVEAHHSSPPVGGAEDAVASAEVDSWMPAEGEMSARQDPGAAVAEPCPNSSEVDGPGLAALLWEDSYPCWLHPRDLSLLRPMRSSDSWHGREGLGLPEAELAERVGAAVDFALAAAAVPNHYLWGGTVGPNFDCSGLVQRSFASAGIWIPRDAYQQEAFVEPVPAEDVRWGDLVFFGRERATHVGICLASRKGDTVVCKCALSTDQSGVGLHSG